MWPLVGRDAELACLTAMLVEAKRTGQPRIAVIAGELGVGKTRLLNEVAAWAGARGISVGRARAMSFMQQRSRRR